MLSNPQAVEAAIHVMRSKNPVFMIKLPAVYALVAPPTLEGVNALNNAKRRLPGKCYGSLIGRSEPFFELANRQQTPAKLLSDPAKQEAFQGAFIRLHTTTSDFGLSVIRDDTHQGLLLPVGPLRQFFVRIEDEFTPLTSTVFAPHPYKACLCTSANISGDPEGSITSFDRAMEFARLQKLPLVVHQEALVAETGSYPIIAVHRNHLSIERAGPGLQQILDRLQHDWKVL